MKSCKISSTISSNLSQTKSSIIVPKCSKHLHVCEYGNNNATIKYHIEVQYVSIANFDALKGQYMVYSISQFHNLHLVHI